MKKLSFHLVAVGLCVVAVPVLMGADGNGCGGDVTVEVKVDAITAPDMRHDKAH